jgi:hypothetical protein
MSSANKFIARWREALPEDLFDMTVFLLWLRRPKPGKPGKFDKLPHYANGRQRHGVNGSAEDRAQLVEIGDAFAAYALGRYDGIGLALLPDVGFWALDLDNCINDGKLSPLAHRVVDTGTYTERSPSGSGVRALFAGKAGADAKNHGAGVETFDSRGFVTLTGDRLGGDSMLACAHDLLAEILDTVQAGRRRRNLPSAARADVPPENPSLTCHLNLSARLRVRLAYPYPAGCDRSATAYSIALQLKREGVTAQQTLELLSAPQILVPALERRSGDIAAAREWLWRYVIAPAFATSGSAT